MLGPSAPGRQGRTSPRAGTDGIHDLWCTASVNSGPWKRSCGASRTTNVAAGSQSRQRRRRDPSGRS